MLVPALVVGLAIVLVGGIGVAQGPWPQGDVLPRAALGTGFTYQGRLTDDGSPANGSYDFRFILYDAEVGGSQVGDIVIRDDVAVTDGFFTVELDFGSDVFTGDARYLEVSVREGSSTGSYTILSPRQAITAVPYALYAFDANVSSGVRVESTGVDGVHVVSAGDDGVDVESAEDNGLQVSSAGKNGLYVGAADDDGVHINEADDNGVQVDWAAGDGVHVTEAGGYAGYFGGNVYVTGNLYKGGGGFKIDHPLDPEHKYLQHSFVESPDMMDIYNGNVTLDEAGEAWVELPEWFEVLNRDFRYQLTPIGAPAPGLYIAEEVKGNRFKIAGGEPGLRVSWQVTGIRCDPYAEAHRIPVEGDKLPEEQGTYLHPVAYGLPKEMGLSHREGCE